MRFSGKRTLSSATVEENRAADENGNNIMASSKMCWDVRGFPLPPTHIQGNIPPDGFFCLSTRSGNVENAP